MSSSGPLGAGARLRPAWSPLRGETLLAMRLAPGHPRSRRPRRPARTHVPPPAQTRTAVSAMAGRQSGARGPMRMFDPRRIRRRTQSQPEGNSITPAPPVARPCASHRRRGSTPAARTTRSEPHGEQRFAAERTPHRPQARPGSHRPSRNHPLARDATRRSSDSGCATSRPRPRQLDARVIAVEFVAYAQRLAFGEQLGGQIVNERPIP